MTIVREWLAVRTLVLVRANQICEGCGRSQADEVHHRQPRGMGGVHGGAALHANSPANLLALCRVCHDRTEDQPEEMRRLGWLVPHYTDAWTTPAYLRLILGQAWWYLLPDLSYQRASDEDVAAFLRRVSSA